MNTGMNLRPLWTANVSPTMSGMTKLRREYVVITRLFGLVSFSAAVIFFVRYLSTNGPFLVLRGMGHSYLRRRMMNCSVRLLWRVLRPLVLTPHGVHG